MSRVAIALTLLVAIGTAIVVLSRGAGLSDLDDLRATVAAVRARVDAHPAAAAGLFALAYVAVTALSLPLALWLTLAGGALFGHGIGIPLVALSATAGATLAFLAARHLLRDAVTRRFADRMAAIDRGVARDGWRYLLSLRLVPAIPFFAVNLAMGLTAMPLRSYVVATFVGMLPATAIYVNAGVALGRLRSPSDILTLPAAGSLVLLAALPWVARIGAGVLHRSRPAGRWTRPRRFDRNLIVIGAGAAGLVASLTAATARARVTLVEAGRMGGECLNTGCVPSKALLASARAAEAQRRGPRFGLAPAPVVVDFPAVMRRVAGVIAAIAPHDSAERYRSLGAEVLAGRARLVDPWTVEIALAAGGTTRRSARHIVIATGSAPVVPAIEGLTTTPHVTTDTLWDRLAQMDAAPARMAILGGGAVGVELGQALQRLGSAVTLIEAGPRLLPREDPEAVALVTGRLEAEGVRILTETRALSAAPEGDGARIELAGPAGRESLRCDLLLVATGRRPRLDGIGLDDLGLDPADPGAWPESLILAGDADGGPQLTHRAGASGWATAMRALAAPFWRPAVPEDGVARVVFTDPELASCGLSEAEARARGLAVETTRFDLGTLDRALADGDGDGEGIVKVLTRAGSDRILGTTIVGPHASDLAGLVVLAMRRRIGLGALQSVPFAYPTYPEALGRTGGQWRLQRLSPRLLGLAQRWNDLRRR